MYWHYCSRRKLVEDVYVPLVQKSAFLSFIHWKENREEIEGTPGAHDKLPGCHHVQLDMCFVFATQSLYIINSMHAMKTRKGVSYLVWSLFEEWSRAHSSAILSL